MDKDGQDNENIRWRKKGGGYDMEKERRRKGRGKDEERMRKGGGKEE